MSIKNLSLILFSAIALGAVLLAALIKYSSIAAIQFLKAPRRAINPTYSPTNCVKAQMI